MHPSEEGNDAPAAQREMPCYKSHKTVWALEISAIGAVTDPAGSYIVTFKEPGYASLILPPEMFGRYVPVVGDFYVVYSDGYKSFSPRKAFLDGYTAEGETFREIKDRLQ